MIATLLLGIGSMCGAAENEAAKPTVEQASQLVEQLGDAEYARREEATDQLISIGLPAEKALKEGVEHSDREIRHRCSRILHIVQAQDFQRRLTAFVKGGDKDIHLPAWKPFREKYGDTHDSRTLFVELQKSEHASLQAVEDGPKAVTAMLASRTVELQNMIGLFRQQLSYGNVAAMIFMASIEGVTLTPQVSSVLYGFCYQPNFRNELMNGERKEISRRLMWSWIQRGEGWTLYQALNLAMQYDLKEGLIPAERALREGPNQPHILQYAILAIARFGDKKHIEEILPMLEKAEGKNRIGSQRINNVTYEAQLRDVALAAMIHLAGDDPKDFGFERYQPNTQNVFNPGTVGFKSEEDRKAAQEKWKKRRLELAKETGEDEPPGPERPQPVAEEEGEIPVLPDP